MDDTPEAIDTSDWPDPSDRQAGVLWRMGELRSGDPYRQLIADWFAVR